MRIVLATMLALAVAGPSGAQAPHVEPLIFVADLQGRFVAPARVETASVARATGVLVGSTFTVHGSFSGLSSPLRDIVARPQDPGVHLHRGAPGTTTPYFHGLQVTLNPDERSGIFYGRATLTDDQRRALLATESYVDIHTVKHGPGEVRDQWRPLDKVAAGKLLVSMGGAREDDGTGRACHLKYTRLQGS